MATSLQAAEANPCKSCKLVSLFESTGGDKKSIDLPHEKEVQVGRGKSTGVRSTKCSRRQLRLTADYHSSTVRVEQIGENPSFVGGATLATNEQSVLGPSGVIELPGRYRFAVFFEADWNGNGNKSPSSHLETAEHLLDEDCDSDLPTMEMETETCTKKHPKGKGKKLAVSFPRKRNPTSDQEVCLQKDDKFEEDEEDSREVSVRKKRKIDSDEDSHVPTFEIETGTGTKHQTSLSSFLKGPGKSRDSHTTGQWEWIDSVKVFRSSGDDKGLNSSLVLFDLDYTLTATRSGRKFSRDENDWQWLYPSIPARLRELVQVEGRSVVVLSNQASVGRVKKEADLFTKKIQFIAQDLGQPLLVLAATGKDKYRKPRPGMWELVVREGRRQGVEIRTDNCFYVGDAAGRPDQWAPKKKKDFSCSDRKFAANVGLRFFTPEEYFLKQGPAPFSWGDFDPRELLKNPPQLLQPPDAKIVSSGKEIVVFVGAPGCGKSTFYRQHMAKDYGYANRDTLGTWQNCVKTAEKCMLEGRSVAIDNTNSDPVVRKRYIDVAQRFKVPVRCLLFTASVAHARHNNAFREVAATDPNHKKVPEQVFNIYKGRFVEPDVGEGFGEIVSVNFVPQFKSPAEQRLYEQFYS